MNMFSSRDEIQNDLLHMHVWHIWMSMASGSRQLNHKCDRSELKDRIWVKLKKYTMTFIYLFIYLFILACLEIAIERRLRFSFSI
jgi:hypothetical protein